MDVESHLRKNAQQDDKLALISWCPRFHCDGDDKEIRSNSWHGHVFHPRQTHTEQKQRDNRMAVKDYNHHK